MSQCIYCLKKEGEVSFKNREHVVPSSLGSFQPLNPTLLGSDGLVCDICNGEVFSPLETLFTEDTLEGVYGQRLRLTSRNSITIRNELFKINRLSSIGDNFFDEMFFFLKHEDTKIVPEAGDQIKIHRKQGGYRIFIPENLYRMKKDTSAFRKIKNDISKLEQKDIRIFGRNKESIARIIALLKTFGVNYKEKEQRELLFQEAGNMYLEEDYTCIVNKEIGRVLAKIAFNYFAYCALQDKKTYLLFHENFDVIRQFVHSGKGEMKSVVVAPNEEPILLEERTQGKRIIAHLINFLLEDGKIILRVTFFGQSAVYKIILGEIPVELSVNGFGCAHIFDPFNFSIMNLSQRMPFSHRTAEELKLSFGLYKRYS